MADSERQKVDLTRMGVWGKAVRIELGSRYEDVWLQTIGDRTEALERGHEAMQRKLLEFRPGGERMEALREALSLAPVEDLIELALTTERHQVETRLRREIPDPVRPRRDRAVGESDEGFARRLAEYEEQCEDIERRRSEKLKEMMGRRREELAGMSRRELAELASPRRVDVECWNSFARTVDDWVLLRAVRKAGHHEEPYFQDVSEVRALHPVVKEQLRRAYRELEPDEGDEFPKGSAPCPSSV